MTGSNDFANLNIGYRQIQSQFDDRPGTFFLNADAAIFPKDRFVERLNKAIANWTGGKPHTGFKETGSANWELVDSCCPTNLIRLVS